MPTRTLVEYQDERGRSPFGLWFARLNAQAAAMVGRALYRLAKGNFSDVKAVGQGVSEYRLSFGPGCRIYFAQDGETLLVLLAGGTRKHQSRDVETAQVRWRNYRCRKCMK